MSHPIKVMNNIKNNVSDNKSSLGIYIHIPFCKSRCIYCDFVSSVDDLAQREKYTQYLCRQIKLASKEYSQGYTVDTLYFGGGTPTLLDKTQLRAISSEVFKNFQCNLKEFSIEANPCTVDRESLIALKEIGVNRISFGVQSFNDELLKMLGRRHNSREAQEVVALAKELGFDVSVDAMIGLSNQTKADVKDFVDRAEALGVNHISVYMLSVEDGTKLKSLIEDGKLVPKSDDELAELYEYACDCLREYGFERYEISNFCKDKKVSYHNLRYWKRFDYLGLGMGAHSLTKGERWRNANNFEEYYKSIDDDNYRLDLQKLSADDIESEYVMLALRLKDGVDLDEYSKQFGCDFLEKYSKAITKNKNYLDVSNKRVAIKYEYLQLMNGIIVDFI